MAIAAPAPLSAARRKPAAVRLRESLSFQGRITLPMALYLVFTVVPFYWIFLFAFREAGSTAWFPWPLTFDNFVTVWNEVGYRHFFWNSMWVGVATTAATLLLALPSGYALARFRFKGKGGFMLVLLCTQFIPGAMMLIPLFQAFNALGLINNLASLIIADTVFGLPLAIMFMQSFISKVPFELEEAAMIDGCSRFHAFRLAVLPVLGPATIAVGSFSFINAWNNFLFGLMFIHTQERFTLPVGLSFTMGEFGVDFGVLAAGGLVAALPVIVIFAFIQKYLVQGLGAGAVKG
ncbi:carbohydrate ABC transporter permease [Microbacterium sp. Marseille-Q6965]|uniref:carbohydrate ABC transporter permease n=1 Tax=Microbacterium sp. Marseille-Q6965 TaxID=2965072 RepID=UPI0021B7D66C|nr:carbohydrate ABC transporter permease [Microbacterium sp. Marseille-Q6965]